MATNLELAKQELAKVGGLLNREASNPRVKKLLLALKNVNTELTKIINGDDEFSFDDLDESTSLQRKRVAEVQQRKKVDTDFGVDLGGFDNFVNAKDPNGFDWKATMREANGSARTNVDIDLEDIENSEYDADLYGRMVDNT